MELNLHSSDHLSLLFFGGTVKEQVELPIKNEDGSYVIYKSGKRKNEIKYRKETVIKKITGLSLNPIKEWKSKKDGKYNLDESRLDIISKKEFSDAGIIAKNIVKLRQLRKEISTYYDGTLNVLSEEGYIHTNYLTCLTATGRISSKNINMQNQPSPESSKVKLHFVSRFRDGRIIVADFKQIEVICFAFLCQDFTLINLLINNKDIHKFIASNLYDKSEEEIDSLTRKQTKPITFTIIYGGGPGRISLNSGLPKEFCAHAIGVFYNLFPESKVWHSKIEEKVRETQTLSLFTGSIFKFKKYPTNYKWQNDKGIYEDYNISQVKDYPCQGLAGDIMFTMLGKLWRKSIKHRDKYLLINTVHDSVMVDARPEYIIFAENIIKTNLEKWKEVCYTTWKQQWELPVIVELSSGTNWYECK